MGRPWTNEDEQHLKDNFNDKTYTELATELNRTFRAVAARARKLKLKKNGTWSEQEDDKLRQLRDEGYTLREIENEMGKSSTFIYQKLRGLGLTNPVGADYILHKAGMLGGK